MGKISIDIGKPYSKTKDFLVNANENFPSILTLHKYAQLGVANLKELTPKLTGKTADSWDYEIIDDSNGITIFWINKNITISNGRYYSVAVLIQNGYVSKYGNWIEPRNYIEPALKPVIEKLNKELSKEAKRL